ncbi:hypothetical protein LT337_32650 (plasmid) [Mycolicibacterium fortuitum]|nr:hypothetical protein LT337_32650 [Mycolicibacterium fortuitum]
MTASETAAAVRRLGERLAVATDTAKHEVQFAQVRRRLQQHLVAIVLDSKKRSETPEVVIALAAAAGDVISPTAFWELVEQYYPDHQITGDEVQFVSNLFALPPSWRRSKRAYVPWPGRRCLRPLTGFLGASLGL